MIKILTVINDNDNDYNEYKIKMITMINDNYDYNECNIKMITIINDNDNDYNDAISKWSQWSIW